MFAIAHCQCIPSSASLSRRCYRRCCQLLKEQSHLKVMSWGVKVLLKILLGPKQSIAFVAFKNASWGVAMLLEGQLIVK